MKLFQKEIFSTENLERIKKEYKCSIRKLPKAGGYKFVLPDNSVLYLRLKKQQDIYEFKYYSKDYEKEFKLWLSSIESYDLDDEDITTNILDTISNILTEIKSNSLRSVMDFFKNNTYPEPTPISTNNVIFYASVLFEENNSSYLPHILSNKHYKDYDTRDIEEIVFLNKSTDFVSVFKSIQDMNTVIDKRNEPFTYNNVEIHVPKGSDMDENNSSSILEMYLKEFLY